MKMHQRTNLTLIKLANLNAIIQARRMCIIEQMNNKNYIEAKG